MTRVLTAITLAAVLVGLGGPARAADIQDELEFLRREVYRLRREIAEMKVLLTRALAAQGIRPTPSPAPRTATVPVAGHPSLGRPDAPLTLVEIASYQCAFCKRHFESVFPKIKTEYIDTGKLRYVFRDLPLRSEPDAPNAARAAHCAGEQSRYWDMHGELFKHPEDLSIEKLKGRAQAIGLDTGKFSQCLDSE